MTTKLTRYPTDTAFHITTKVKDDKSYVERVFHSQPLKMTRALKWKDGGIKVLMMSSSPGLMEGDVYDIQITTKEDSKLWLTSQSYEKVFRSEDIGSSRNTKIKVEKNSYLKYMPLPTIPYVESIFNSDTEIDLEDTSSRFVMSEILTAGRIFKEEEETFMYKRYQTLVNVRVGGELIYRDNAVFEPANFDMRSFGMFEGYTHLANLLIINFKLDADADAKLRAVIDSHDKVEGGLTRLASGDVLIRLFGTSGQKLTDVGEELIELSESL